MRYAEIIKEAQQPEQLAEGIVDKLQASKDKIMKMFTPQELQQIAGVVQQATGGDTTLNSSNAQKVGAALSGAVSEEMGNEGPPGDYGIARTTAGKLKQVAYALGMVGAGAAMASGLGEIGIVALFLGGMMAPAMFNRSTSEIDKAPAPQKPQTDINGNPI